MKIIEYIEKLRREPIEVRRQAVTFWTGVTVAFVVALYCIVLLFQTFVFTGDTSSAAASGLVPPYSQSY